MRKVGYFTITFTFFVRFKNVVTRVFVLVLLFFPPNFVHSILITINRNHLFPLEKILSLSHVIFLLSLSYLVFSVTPFTKGVEKLTLGRGVNREGSNFELGMVKTCSI